MATWHRRSHAFAELCGRARAPEAARRDRSHDPRREQRRGSISAGVPPSTFSKIEALQRRTEAEWRRVQREVMRPMRTIVLVTLALLLLTSCGDAENGAAGPGAELVRQEQEHQRELEAGEREFVTSLQRFESIHSAATAVTLYEISNEFDAGYSTLQANPRMAGYPITRRERLSKDSSRPLVKVLASRSTYFPPGQEWSCIFEPHHVLELTSRGNHALAVICLKCGDIEYIINGKSIGTRSIPSGKELHRILKDLLPATAA